MQIFVAERTHSQWIQCKFHLPLGKYTTLFWEVLQCYFVVVVYQVFLFDLFFLYISPFYLEDMGRSGNKEGRAVLFIF